MNQAEYARHRAKRGLPGGTAPGVERALRSGRISLIDGRIDPTIADEQWEENTRKRIDFHNDDSDSPIPSWTESKARTEYATAGLKELELEKRRGELIDRAGYEMAATQSARELSEALIVTWPSKIALELCQISDPWKMECAIRQSLREVMHAICNRLDESTDEGH